MPHKVPDSSSKCCERIRLSRHEPVQHKFISHRHRPSPYPLPRRGNTLTISSPFPSSLPPTTYEPSKLKLKLRTAPTMALKLRRHTHSDVSHSVINASDPPTAKYLPRGQSSKLKHALVCACNVCRTSMPGHPNTLTLPSPVVTNTSRAGTACPKAVWFVCTACGSGGPRTPMAPVSMATSVSSLRPTSTALPSPAHASVKASPPTATLAVQALLRTSQKRTVPSDEHDASSASFVGFQATRSMPPVCARSSVLFFTAALSGFQIRRVRSAEPVAIRRPVGFQARVRRLGSGVGWLVGVVLERRGGWGGERNYVWEPGVREEGSW